MYGEQSVAVVVPAHDEAAFVGGVVEAVPSFVDSVYVVDDASGDGTRDAALAAAAGEVSPHSPDRLMRADGAGPVGRTLAERVDESTRCGRVVVLRHGANRGPGGAVKTGYLAAVAGDVDLVATVDADGQMDPARLSRFLDPLVAGDADYATGTRLRHSEDRTEMPAFRLFGNALLTLLCRVASGYWSLSDPVNGYTALTREALEAVRPRTMYEGYGYGVQVLGRLHAAGCRVADVPMSSTYGDEDSGIDYATYVPRVSGLLAATLFDRLREEYLPDGRRLPSPVTERGWRE